MSLILMEIAKTDYKYEILYRLHIPSYFWRRTRQYRRRTCSHMTLYFVHECDWSQYVNWRSCGEPAISPCLTGPVDYPFASHHKGPGIKFPAGYLCETGILLLALSRYIGDPNVIDHCGLVWGGTRFQIPWGDLCETRILPVSVVSLQSRISGVSYCVIAVVLCVSLIM